MTRYDSTPDAEERSYRCVFGQTTSIARLGHVTTQVYVLHHSNAYIEQIIEAHGSDTVRVERFWLDELGAEHEFIREGIRQHDAMIDAVTSPKT